MPVIDAQSRVAFSTLFEVDQVAKPALLQLCFDAINVCEELEASFSVVLRIQVVAHVSELCHRERNFIVQIENHSVISSRQLHIVLQSLHRIAIKVSNHTNLD